jgi:uncharacterized lipoprotein YmbA
MVRRVAVVFALWMAVCGVARAQLGLYVMGRAVGSLGGTSTSLQEFGAGIVLRI